MIEIIDIQTSLGSIKEKNADIEDLVGWAASEIQKKTGISQRFISNDNETTETLALDSFSKVSKKNNIKELDLIISVTNTPNYSFPTLGHYVHEHYELNSPRIIGLNSGCSGFVDALLLLYNIFQSTQINNGVIITSDTYSKFIDDTARSTRTLFSDGASSTYIEKNPNGMFLSDFTSSSLKNSFKSIAMTLEEQSIEMNGPKVLHFGLTKVIPELNSILSGNENISIFAHQAGKIMFDAIESKLIGNHIVFKNFNHYGNLVSTSIPNLIKCNFLNFKESDDLVLTGFGVGLTHTAMRLKR